VANIKVLDYIKIQAAQTIAFTWLLCAMAIRIYSHRQNKTQRHIGLARPLRNLIKKKNFNPETAFCGPAARITDRPLHKAPYVSGKRNGQHYKLVNLK